MDDRNKDVPGSSADKKLDDNKKTKSPRSENKSDKYIHVDDSHVTYIGRGPSLGIESMELNFKGNPNENVQVEYEKSEVGETDPNKSPKLKENKPIPKDNKNPNEDVPVKSKESEVDNIDPDKTPKLQEKCDESILSINNISGEFFPNDVVKLVDKLQNSTELEVLCEVWPIFMDGSLADFIQQVLPIIKEKSNILVETMMLNDNKLSLDDVMMLCDCLQKIKILNLSGCDVGFEGRELLRVTKNTNAKTTSIFGVYGLPVKCLNLQEHPEQFAAEVVSSKSFQAIETLELSLTETSKILTVLKDCLISGQIDSKELTKLALLAFNGIMEKEIVFQNYAPEEVHFPDRFKNFKSAKTKTILFKEVTQKTHSCFDWQEFLCAVYLMQYISVDEFESFFTWLMENLENKSFQLNLCKFLYGLCNEQVSKQFGLIFHLETDFALRRIILFNYVSYYLKQDYLSDLLYLYSVAKEWGKVMTNWFVRHLPLDIKIFSDLDSTTITSLAEILQLSTKQLKLYLYPWFLDDSLKILLYQVLPIIVKKSNIMVKGMNLSDNKLSLNDVMMLSDCLHKIERLYIFRCGVDFDGVKLMRDAKQKTGKTTQVLGLPKKHLNQHDEFGLVLGNIFTPKSNKRNKEKKAQNNSDTESKVIGVEGGRVEVLGCYIDIPKGALNKDVQITVRVVHRKKLTSLTKENPTYLLTPQLECLPHGLNFNVPVKILLSTSYYSTTKTCVVTPQVSGDRKVWEDLADVILDDSGSIQFYVTHLSWYQVLTSWLFGVNQYLMNPEKKQTFECYYEPPKSNLTLYIMDPKYPIKSKGERVFIVIVPIRQNDDVEVQILHQDFKTFSRAYKGTISQSDLITTYPKPESKNKNPAGKIFTYLVTNLSIGEPIQGNFEFPNILKPTVSQSSTMQLQINNYGDNAKVNADVSGTSGHKIIGNQIVDSNMLDDKVQELNINQVSDK